MAPGSIESIQQDIIELKNLLENHVKRESNRILLNNQIISLEKLVNSSPTITKDTTPQLALNPVTNYAWDQTDKFVKIYLNLNDLGLQSGDGVAVDLTFPSENTVQAICGHKKFYLTKLGDKIETNESFYKFTKQHLVLNLKKKKEEKWPNLQQTNTKSSKNEKDDFLGDGDPGSALINLMKKMYNEGDDDMKRTIAKSWHEAQTKKGSDISMPDL
ncbi:calcyclin-binding protein [Brevipalpus obovatus]|uniref:calcyclin-binding protein n=1 Tax=Brevipalpus obovatus TaxID=246614 RepID=UPI003D9E6BC5